MRISKIMLAGQQSFLRQASCASEVAAAAGKPWRLSASVVVMAPTSSVPKSDLSSAGLAGQDYKVCLVRRAARSSFMPDVMVFPGGAVEAKDIANAGQLIGAAAEDLEATLRCAAVREVFEESGIGIFEPADIVQKLLEGPVDWRQAVSADASKLSELCKVGGVRPAAAALKPWCSFVTPDFEHQKIKKGGFYTHFFVWAAPPGSHDQISKALADGQETTSLVWLAPDEALAAQAAGRIALAPPQWYIFKELAENCPQISGVSSYAESHGRALQRDYPIKPYPGVISADEAEAFQGRISSKETNVVCLAYPGDETHPVFPGPVGARHRMLIAGSITSGASQYELQKSENVPLPLQESSPGWHSLAKL
mmetsp:Transcript_85863/g.152067  ORF Transcript_85863/g.152067 Transcript_85863/m.152067 type:complete len:367 (+) Transcript_85863:49-1149(+)